MKRLISFILLPVFMIIFFACTNNNPEVFTVEPSEKILLDAKQLYKQSSLVVFGNCTATVVDNKSDVCYTIQVSEVIAGEIDNTRTIQVTGRTLDVGNGYLLFLTSIDDSDCFEMTNNAYRISEKSVLWDGTWVNLKTILNELYDFASTITIPGTTYFYTKLKDLSFAADAIFIGKVLDSPTMNKIKVKSQIDGAIVENVVGASIVNLTVYGSIKGDLEYGSTIRLVNIPSSVSTMTDAITLDPVSLSQNYVIRLANENTYMFFIQKTNDIKQDYYFPLNPVQGWISIERDFVTVARFNTPLYGYKTLSLLIRDVKSSIIIS